MMENWKNYDATHKVSDHGRVMWFDGKEWKLKKARTDKQGELEMSFKGYKLYVKRLVASLFVDNPKNYQCVFCKDGDKTNCRADNLEWGTRIGRNHKGLNNDIIMSRIAEKHGARFIMLGDYEKACNPVQFRCTKCGKDFYQTPHLVSFLSEPCPHCKMIKVDELLAKKRERGNEKKHQRDPKEKVYIIYAYIFDDGHAYVGLTKNKHHRDYAHRSDKSSAVFRYSKMTGKAIPKAIILEEGLDEEGAKRYEGLWKKWLSNTFSMLNIAPTGSLGGIYDSVPHTIENARKAKERFRTRKALRWHCRWAWETLKEHGELPPVNDWKRYINKKKHKKIKGQMIIQW